MSATYPDYVIRRVSGTRQYVIDAKWSDGQRQQLIGVYVSETFAARIAKEFRRSPPLEFRTLDAGGIDSV